MRSSDQRLRLGFSKKTTVLWCGQPWNITDPDNSSISYGELNQCWFLQYIYITVKQKRIESVHNSLYAPAASHHSVQTLGDGWNSTGNIFLILSYQGPSTSQVFSGNGNWEIPLVFSVGGQCLLGRKGVMTTNDDSLNSKSHDATNITWQHFVKKILFREGYVKCAKLPSFAHDYLTGKH